MATCYLQIQKQYASSVDRGQQPRCNYGARGTGATGTTPRGTWSYHYLLLQEELRSVCLVPLKKSVLAAVASHLWRLPKKKPPQEKEWQHLPPPRRILEVMSLCHVASWHHCPRSQVSSYISQQPCRGLLSSCPASDMHLTGHYKQQDLMGFGSDPGGLLCSYYQCLYNQQTFYLHQSQQQQTCYIILKPFP